MSNHRTIYLTLALLLVFTSSFGIARLASAADDSHDVVISASIEPHSIALTVAPTTINFGQLNLFGAFTGPDVQGACQYTGGSYFASIPIMVGVISNAPYQVGRIDAHPDDTAALAGTFWINAGNQPTCETRELTFGSAAWVPYLATNSKISYLFPGERNPLVDPAISYEYFGIDVTPASTGAISVTLTYTAFTSL